MSSAYAIRCKGLTKTYPGRPPVEAVRGIDLSVLPGECFGVLGPNGAGKTTTIEILEGLLEPSGGELEILGMQWRSERAKIRELIGISLQETRLAERLSVLETIRLFRSFYPRSLPEQEVLRRVALVEKAGAWVKQLSGGQRQRLALAIAMVGDPQLLFLDEPTTGLDPKSRRDLWELIRQFRQRGRTVLLTTHYMEEAERLCDRVAIFDRGQVIAQGTPAELIHGLGAAHVVEFSLAGAPEVDASSWQNVAEVTSAIRTHDGYRLTVGQPHVTLPDLLRQVAQRGLTLASLTTRHASLDDVFVQLTGHTFEEAENMQLSAARNAGREAKR